MSVRTGDRGRMNADSLPLPSGARFVALAIAAGAFATLMLQLWLTTGALGGVLAALSNLSQFFTILTNTFVALLMAAIWIGGRMRGRLYRALLVAILGVGIVYHVVLARLWNPQGLAYVADQGLHTCVPAAALAWWLVYAPKGAARWNDVGWAIAWPLTYCVYALTRAQFSGFYPYPFLDLTTLGWHGLVRSLAALTVAFMVLAGVVVALDGLIGGRGDD